MRTFFLTAFWSLTTLIWAQNTIGTTSYSPELASEGYTLLYPHNQPNVYLLDMCGEVVHSWTNADTLRPGNMAYLQDNGDIVMTYRPQLFANDAIWAGGGGETIERRTWDNEVLWSYSLNDSTGRFHHDIEVKPDGNVFAIAWEYFSPEACLEAGRDSAMIPENGLWAEMILELQPDGNGSADVVWQWHAWDHLIQDFDSTKANFGVISENPSLIDVNFGSVSNPPSDWLHINAIDYDPYFDHLLLSVPTFNELWIVDYDNLNEGELLWRWGNPAAYDMGTAEDQKLFYQHDCRWVYDVSLGNPSFGKIAVFNNRVPSEGGGIHSAAHLLNPAYADYDNTFAVGENATFEPADFDWTYVAPDSIASSGLSSFQRLENGNSLICYGRWGDIREITPEGDLAWRYRTPLVNAGGVANPVAQGTEPSQNQNMTFRAHRISPDFPGLAGQDLTPMGVLELDPTPLEPCALLEGCMDMLACNYDSTATVPSMNCEYDSPSFEATSLFVLGVLEPETGCNGGYAVSSSLPVTLVTTENGLTWEFDPATEQILIDNGYELLVTDLTNQLVSLCGDAMNVLDGMGNAYTLIYDGTGYINPVYGGYIAPAQNFNEGCGFEFACNYDPCAIYNFDLCEFLDVEVNVFSDNGTGNGMATATANGGVEPYTYAWYAGSDNDAFAFGSNVDSLTAGEYSVVAVDSTGCIGGFDFVIETVVGVLEAADMLNIYPNPASDVLRIQISANQIGYVWVKDLAGREVISSPLQGNTATLDLSAVPAGTYVIQVSNGETTQTQKFQIVR
ncbi:MAG: T9SS type A sorting domain-containing protein [Flavobacteriales bacterium]